MTHTETKARTYYLVEERTRQGWMAHRGYYTEKAALDMLEAMAHITPGEVRIRKDGEIWAVR